jgi:predicted small metal-binding protein
MAKLVCADYGYDCKFVVEGESDQVAEKFRIHTEEEHGIDYSKETLTKFMLDNNY